MAFDQNITYRVNIDDADFQAKLSQLRASLDMSMGGGGGFGGGASMAAFGAMMAPQGFARGQTDMMMSGLADFGAQIRPITYTPPAIAMQPHFGMYALQQSTGQAFLGAMGPAAQAGVNFVQHPMGGGPRSMVPNQLTTAEYMALSARSLATRVGDAASTATLVGAGTAAQIAAGGAGSMVAGWLGMGSLGALGLGALAALPVAAAVSATGDMVADNRAIQTQLESSSFRFLTGGKDVDSLTGRGFSRRARANVADFIQTEELHDPRFGMGDYKQILEAGTQMDVFSGVKDVEGFKTKFKGLVESVKTITTTLHTSVKEAVEAVRGFRDMGVTDPNEIRQLTMQSEMRGRVSGHTGMEMVAIGQEGAELFRGTGVRMRLGYDAEQRNVENVRYMLNQGTISRETIAQAGGENALARQMTGADLAGTQTALGRGLLMSAVDARTGKVDVNRMGRGGVMGALGRAANMSPMDIITFQARQEELVGSMSAEELATFNTKKTMMEAELTVGTYSRNRKGTAAYQQDLDLTFLTIQKREGVPIDVARARLAGSKIDPKKQKMDQESASRAMQRQQRLEHFRDRFSPKRLSNLARLPIQLAQRGVTGVSNVVGYGIEGGEEALMDYLGGGDTTEADQFAEANVSAEEESAAEAKKTAEHLQMPFEKMISSLGKPSGAGMPSVAGGTTTKTGGAASSVGSSGSLAGVTNETLVQMQNMSTQLVKNMEVLMALQKQFNDLQGKK